MVVKGPNLSGNISGTDPLKDNRLLLEAKALDDSHYAKNTAAVVNELSKEITKILVSHPVNAKRAAEGKNIANVVLLRGCGIRIEVCFSVDNIIYRFIFQILKSQCTLKKIKLQYFSIIYIFCYSGKLIKYIEII